jgi:hypothetical protein
MKPASFQIQPSGGAMREDKLIRFSIAPRGAGAWLWRTLERDGRVRSQGIAPSKKIAAALVVREIIAARLGQAQLDASPPAKAA